MRYCLAVLSLLGAGLAVAQPPAAVIKNADEIDWKVSGSLPPSAEYHLIYEDPATRAVQTLVRFPSGYALPPHSHTHDETIFVLKGKLVIDFGEHPTTLSAGSYATIPADMSHSLKAKGACTMLISLSGPFDVKGLPSVK